MGRGLHIMTIADIPVRVSMWYGLLLLYFFRSGSDIRSNLVWTAVVTISILVHELGHAWVARHYRLRPQILLHGLGGLCFHERADRDLHDVFIIAAGPLAGLFLGVLTWIFKLVAYDWIIDNEFYWMVTAIRMSLWVNIGWSLVNLLPIWPLDGGLLFRLLMLRFAKPKLAERVTHVVALSFLVAAIAYMVLQADRNAILIVLVLWIGWSNLQAMTSNSASGPIRSVNKHAKHLLEQAEVAFANQDFEEAARLSQQIRNEQNVAENVLKRVWTILGVSAAHNGDHEEALSFLQHAKPSREVTESTIECLYALGRDQELEALLASAQFAQLPAARREEIMQVISQGE